MKKDPGVSSMNAMKKNGELPLGLAPTGPLNPGGGAGLFLPPTPSPTVTPPFHPSAPATPHLPTPPPTPTMLPLQPLTNINNLPLQSLSTNAQMSVKPQLPLPTPKFDSKKDCLHLQVSFCFRQMEPHFCTRL